MSHAVDESDNMPPRTPLAREKAPRSSTSAGSGASGPRAWSKPHNLKSARGLSRPGTVNPDASTWSPEILHSKPSPRPPQPS